MKRSLLMLAIAFVLGLTALGAAIVYFASAPTVLRIAVGPVGSEDTRIVVTILQTFAREKHPVRLRLVPSDSPLASADLLRTGKADLAIVRSDGNVPPNAATVAILHRDALLIMAPADKTIRTVADLAGRRIGLLRSGVLDQKLLDLVLMRNGIDPARTERVMLRPNDIRTAVQSGQVDAVLFVGPPAGTNAARIFADLFLDDGRAPAIIRLADSEAIAQSSPVVEATTVLRGTFGGSPPRPAENIETIAVTHRLVADRALKDQVVADLAKSLFEIRQSVAAEIPNFARIEAPDTETLGPMLVHPGAATYFEGEQKSFIEQYGEWIYIAIMGVSLLGSVIAALLSRQLSGRPPAGTGDIDRLLMLLRRARLAESEDDLDEIQEEADEVFGRTLERAAAARIDETVMSAFTIALSEVRAAVDERRGQLRQEDEDDEDVVTTTKT